MFHCNTFTLFLCLFAQTLTAQGFIPGNTYYGTNDYIRYTAGNLPIIISAPHGGSLKPTDIPDRNCAQCVYDKDAYTEELADELKAAIVALTGCYPHVITNRLHRIKLDANRNLTEAADGNALAEQAWRDFHGFIDSAKQQVLDAREKGLYIDLHGHGHTIQRIELGYLLYSDELQASDNTLNSTAYINNSGLRNLVGANLTGLSHVELLRGPKSFGTLLDNKGYPSVPSTTIPYPLASEDYFSGGYNTARHSSYNSGTIDGFQVECNQSIRFETVARQKFADSLALVIVEYMAQHYFMDFAQNSCTAVSQTNVGASSGHEPTAVMPNPACNLVMIGPAYQAGTLRIYAPTGQVMKRLPMEHTPTVAVGDLAEGWYFFVFQSAGKMPHCECIHVNCR